MKRIASVCMVAVRQTLWKLLAIIALMAAVEIGLYWSTMPAQFYVMEPGVRFREFEEALFFWFLRGAVVLLFVCQFLQGSDNHGKLTYTLRRLPMGERAVTTLWGLVHMMSYWILWAAQLAVVFVCWRKYMSCYSVYAPTLELFTQFYRGEFLHGLIPLENYPRVAANALMFLALGFGAAYGGFLSRTGRKVILPIFLCSVSMSMFPADFRDDLGDELHILFYVLATVYMLWQIWVNDYEET